MNRWAVFGAIVAIGLGLVVGGRLWTGRPRDGTAMTGQWEGSYVCGQGETLMRLTLRGNKAGRLAGDFFFTGGGQHPEIPDGKFRVSGSYSQKTGRVRLYGGEWIDLPDDTWQVVNLAGTVDWGGGGTMKGTVEGPDCTTFSLWRRG